MRTSRRNRVVVIALAALLVAGTAGVVVAASGGSHGPDDQDAPTSSPVLHLARTQTSDESLLAGSAATPASSSNVGTYQLTGTLPSGPDEGVVIDPSSSTASAAKVTALTKALGFTTTPKRVDDGWTARGTVRGEAAYFDLDETGGNVWAFADSSHSVCGGSGVTPGQAASPDSSSVGCAAAPTTSSASRHAGREALVRDAAGVFKAVGVTPGKGLAATNGDGVTTLSVPLTVEDLPVVQVSLNVGANSNGLTSANGWLDPRFTTVGEYPLITAQQALDRLNAQPRALSCQVPTPGTPTDRVDGGCVKDRTEKVTSARLAWLPSRDGDHTVLVPAWQFEVGGFYDPAIVAVEPQFLAAPAAGTPESATASAEPAG